MAYTVFLNRGFVASCVCPSAGVAVTLMCLACQIIFSAVPNASEKGSTAAPRQGTSPSNPSYQFVSQDCLKQKHAGSDEAVQKGVASPEKLVLAIADLGRLLQQRKNRGSK